MFRSRFAILLIVTTFTLLSFLIISFTNERHESASLSEVVVTELDLNATFASESIALFSYSTTPSRRTSKNVIISIIIVYTNGTPLENYETALNSVECYAKLHGYPFHLFSDATYAECAKHKDLFFRRHCCIAKFMESKIKGSSWLLVLDADIAVVNPNILIEQFIDVDYDITLFDRFFNFEVGANSYLVRNTERGRAFVHRFAEYEFKLPKSFHGTDNGALHPYLAELLAPKNARFVDSLCAKIWRDSKNYKTLFDMEVCALALFSGKSWVRDVWLLRNRWADDDFMLHAVKEKQMVQLGEQIKTLSDNRLYQWDPTEDAKRIFPLERKLNISKCEIGEEQWIYDSRLKISNEKKATLLYNMETKIFKKRLEVIGRLARDL